MLALVVFGCSKLEDSRNISFVSREANQRTLNALNNITDWAKKTKLKKLNPKDSLQALYELKEIFAGRVTCDLLKDLSNTKRIEDNELVTVKYSYYKDAVCEMKMPDGTKERLLFKEVAAEIRHQDGKRTIIDLRSLNEISITTKPDISVGVPVEFSIKKGESVFSYLPCEWAIVTAEVFGLPIFRGREFFKEEQISPDEARTMIKHRSSLPRISIYTEPMYEFCLDGSDPQKWKLNGLSPTDFRDGFSPNFIRTKIRPPEHERRHGQR